MTLAVLSLEAQKSTAAVPSHRGDGLEDVGACSEVALVVAHALRDRLVLAALGTEGVARRLHVHVLDANFVQFAGERLLPVLGALAPRHEPNVEKNFYALVSKSPTEVRDTSALVADAVADRTALRGLAARARCRAQNSLAWAWGTERTPIKPNWYVRPRKLPSIK